MNIVRTGARSVDKRSWTSLVVKLERFGSDRVIDQTKNIKNHKKYFTVHIPCYLSSLLLLTINFANGRWRTERHTLIVILFDITIFSIVVINPGLKHRLLTKNGILKPLCSPTKLPQIKRLQLWTLLA